MEHNVIFEEKVYLTPKDMNLVVNQSIDKLLLKQLREKLENRCSQHGFVIPGSLEILSRSMGQIENGRYTGNIIFHVQSQGRVLNPANGTRVKGTIIKKNKMGLYVIYKNAIRILVPRDLHLGNIEFENLEKDDEIEIEIRKSRFQIHDQFILSVGVYVGSDGKTTKFLPDVEQQKQESNIFDEKLDSEQEETGEKEISNKESSGNEEIIYSEDEETINESSDSELLPPVSTQA
jgi:DNA-directed RNA polymerase subunit E'/Rpb7